MSASNYLENALLNATLANVSYTTPATVYTALYSVAPTDSTSGTELSGSGYARVSTAFSVSSGVATNTGNVTFGPASADWVTAVAWSIADASSSGNILYYGPISTAQTVLNGNSLTFGIGNVSVTMN
jgi:hypothetical protein